MTMQSKKQFKNQLHAGYIQGNEPQTVCGEAGKQNKIKMQSQSGRSMIEMLGVLAIIAILSIGGIVGYKLAMNHYQADQIAHEMNIMRNDAQIKIAQGTEKLILGEPYDPISESTLGHIQFNDNYPVDFACALADDETVELSNISCHVANAYYIELQNIPEGVCRPLAELANGMNNIIAFNVNKNEYPGEGKCEAGNGNVLNAVFSAEAVSELKVCAGDTDCESENVPYCDPSRHVCVSCYEDNQCEHNQYCENNTCVTCESGVWNGEECVECTADDDCTDSDMPVCYTAEYKCVECLTYSDCKNEERPQCDEASHTCKSCIDIDPEKPVWADTQCVECVNSSTDCEEELVCRENTCSPCETEAECQEKGENYHCSKDKTCIQCLDNQVWDDESKECVECTADNDCADTPDTPKCNTATNQCVECETNEDCLAKGTDEPVCNTDTNTCEPCPTATPIWYNNTCVECTANAQCLERGKDPYCNKETYRCESCPDGGTYEEEHNACVIHIPTEFFLDGAFVWEDSEKAQPKCKKITSTPFGPYEHSYEIWGHGTMDDCIKLYVNSDPDTSDVTQCTTGFKAQKCCCGESKCMDYCSDFSLGELNAGEYANLVVHDKTAYHSWGMSWVDAENGNPPRNDGDIWLILKEE